jgi:membrane-associated phospholipid phosphatase
MRERARLARKLRILAKALPLCVVSTLGGAPRAEAQIEVRPRSAAFWTAAGGVLLGAALADEQLRSASLQHQSSTLARLADAGNAMGSGRNLIAGLAIAYVGARLTGHRAFARRVLHVAAGYAVGNAIVGVAKPIVGRHRPDSTNDAWRFDPFTTSGAYHSFPSSHSVHAFSLAAGAAIVSKHSAVSATAFAAAGVVAWSRVYDDEHWTSDVTASAILGVAAAATTVRWLDARFPVPNARSIPSPLPRPVER